METTMRYSSGRESGRQSAGETRPGTARFLLKSVVETTQLSVGRLRRREADLDGDSCGSGRCRDLKAVEMPIHSANDAGFRLSCASELGRKWSDAPQDSPQELGLPQEDWRELVRRHPIMPLALHLTLRVSILVRQQNRETLGGAQPSAFTRVHGGSRDGFIACDCTRVWGGHFSSGVAARMDL